MYFLGFLSLFPVGVGDGSAVTMSTQYEHKSSSFINQQNKVHIPKQLQPLIGWLPLTIYGHNCCNWSRAPSQRGSDDKAGSGTEARSGSTTVPLRQRSMLSALPSQQCSASTALRAHLRHKAWIAQRHKTMSSLVQPGLHNSPFLFFSKPGVVDHPGNSFLRQ